MGSKSVQLVDYLNLSLYNPTMPYKERVPKTMGKPDIVSVVYGDPRVETAIEMVRSPEGIDNFVQYLRQGYFSRWLGYTPPLILSHPPLSKMLQEALERGLLTPDNFASVMWNQSFQHYPGTVGNIRASLIPFEANLAETNPKFVHRRSVVTFGVEGDLISEVGANEGTVRRKYMMYVGHLQKPNVVPRQWLDQALRFYSQEDLWNLRAVHLNTALDKAPDVIHKVSAASQRVWNSRRVASGVERKGISHPMQGGLPGLGKSSH